jgi:hypothetical protein
MKKLGLEPYYAERTGIGFNWAAGFSWFVTLGVCWYLVNQGYIEIFFVSLPGWFFAALLYVVLSKLMPRRSHTLASA